MAKFIVCGIGTCKNRFKCKYSLRKHIEKCHPWLKFPHEVEKAPVPCPWRRCTLRFHYDDSFEEHVAEVHLKPIDLPDWVEPKEVEKKKRKKPKRNLPPCLFCPKKFVCEKLQIRHMEKKHEEEWAREQRPASQKNNTEWPDAIWIEKMEN